MAPEREALDAILATLAPGRYVDPELIGQGGIGCVFRLRDTQRQRDVAVKVLDPMLLDDPGAGKRFLRGAEALSKLDHPLLPRILRFSSRPSPYLLRAHVPGVTLRTRREGGEVSPGDVAGWLAQVAGALAHAHQRGVVHRDLKPSNLILDAEGRVHVIDFDTALGADQARLTRRGEGSGTYGFTPPEQFRGDTPTPASDVFSLCATGYWLLTGQHAYGMKDLVVGVGASPRPLPEAVPPGLARALLSGLSLAAAHRPADMQALGEALQA